MCVVGKLDSVTRLRWWKPPLHRNLSMPCRGNITGLNFIYLVRGIWRWIRQYLDDFLSITEA